MSVIEAYKRRFIVDLMPEDLLQKAIKFIRENLDPEDVFPEHSLRLWAYGHNMIEKPKTGKETAWNPSNLEYCPKSLRPSK